MKKDYSKKILITGGSGLIGQNLTERLKKNYDNVLAFGSEIDLKNREKAFETFLSFKPDIVFHLAARVGGIYANSNHKFSFYSDNILINTNVIDACETIGVEYIFSMGTGCAYPKKLENYELHENSFLDGEPEVTNDAYAYAKRGLLVHLKALYEKNKTLFTYCLPANIYGPHDNFHKINSHVVPGLIRRFSDSLEAGTTNVKIWGDGTAKRDFLYIEDCIDAMMVLFEKRAQGIFNVASKELTSIKKLAELIKETIQYKHKIDFDTTQLTGQKQRIFNTDKILNLGWNPKTNIEVGLKKTIDWFINNKSKIRER